MDFEAIANDYPMFVAAFLVLMLGFFAGTQLGISAELAEIEESFAAVETAESVNHIPDATAKKVAKK